MITQHVLRCHLLSYFQYALRLLCVALGVGLSAFIGKLYILNSLVTFLAKLKSTRKINLTTFLA